VAYSRNYPEIFPYRLRKTTIVRIAGVRNEIQTEHLRTKNEGLYRFTSPFGSKLLRTKVKYTFISLNTFLFWDLTENPTNSGYNCDLQQSSTKKNYPCTRPWRPIGLWDIEAPIFSRQSAHRWRWNCQPYAPATVYSPRKFPGNHFCQRLSRSQGHSVPWKD
jgi:hypothetical protein